MIRVGTFPFGQPIYHLKQQDKSPKKVFILGVYASAVHARWYGPDKKLRISAMAVASEPEIFWRGENAIEIVKNIQIPPNEGRLVPATNVFNGPSGRALDALFLSPLGLTRDDVWLCDLVPHSCMNSAQEKAVDKLYRPVMEEFDLPDFHWPHLPKRLTTDTRRKEIELEVVESKADIIITLGDHPLKWFTKFFRTKSSLSDFGNDPEEYGRLHPIPEMIGGRSMKLLPLVHPRQAAQLGIHSSAWFRLHEHWACNVASSII